MHIDVLWKALKYLIGIISPLLYGFFFAYILNLIMVPIEKGLRFLDRFKKLQWIRRPLSILLSLVIIALVIAVVVTVVYPQVRDAFTQLANNSNVYLFNFSNWINQFLTQLNLPEDLVSEIKVDWRTLSRTFVNFVKERSDSLGSFITLLTSSLTTTVLYTLIAFFTALHTLAKKENCFRFFQAASKRFLSERVCRNLFHVVEIANHSFSHYLSGQLIEALLYGTLVTIGMMIFRFPYASVIGLLLFLTELIPVAGPWIGTILSTLLIFIISPTSVIWFLLYILILQQVETNFIYPKVVGVHIGLPDLLVLVAVVIGSSRGILGIILSVPIMAIIYTLLKEAIDKGQSKQEDTASIEKPVSSGITEDPTPEETGDSESSEGPPKSESN